MSTYYDYVCIYREHDLIVCVHCVSESVQGKFERQLLDDLLINYNPLERHVSNESDPLEVTFGITLQQIIDVVGILWLYTLFDHKTLLCGNSIKCNLLDTETNSTVASIRSYFETVKRL